ncbi:MAG: restriction endonuclease [Limnospira sp.]
MNPLVQGIIESEQAVKQDLGRRFAAHLGLNPGPPGKDGGIDGYGVLGNKQIYFQCKLYRTALDASFTADFCGNLGIHNADIGIMLSGIGYTAGYLNRLQEFNRNYPNITTHLLKLEDIFSKTDIFKKAQLDLPELRDLSNGAWYKLNQ